MQASQKKGALKMLKKIGASVLLAFTLLISMFYARTITTAYAAPCRSIAECREMQREIRDNIAEIIEEEEELKDEVAEVQEEIETLRDEIAELEERISDLETRIEVLVIQIRELANAIEENLEILEETEEDIEVLLDEVSVRLRLAQRINNSNSFLTVLSEAENLTDFMRVTRAFSRIATEDKELMDELEDLVEFQNNLLLDLTEQAIELGEQTEQLEAYKIELEEDQATLEADQYTLIRREAEMQDRLYRLNLDLIDEEEMLAVIEEAEAILARTPPPPVTTSRGSSSTSSSSSSSSSAPQTPNASGLAHPMPGAIVTDEFGTRGGTHRGIDLAVVGNPSAPILAAADGTVTTAGWNNGGFGYYVIISHNINGQRIDTLYAHLRYQPVVSAGSTVEQGEQIGNKGNTGQSFGAHLHFEVHPGGISWGPGRGANPRNWINF